MARSSSVASVPLLAFCVCSLVAPRSLATPARLLPQVAVRAGGAPRVAVIAVPLDAQARTQLGLLEHVGEDAIARGPHFEAVSLTDALQPEGYGQRLKRAEEAEEKVVEAKKALDDLDNVKGNELLVESLKLFLQTDLSRRFPDYMRTWVLKAAAHATGGENKQAAEEIERITTVYPEAEFLGTFFPPELIKLADGRRKAAKLAVGELTINTTPAGARVWVDGQFRGTSPVLVKALMTGEHVVTARLAGYAFSQEVVGLGAHTIALSEAEGALKLHSAAGKIARDPDGPGRDAAALALGVQLGVDQVLVFVARKSPVGEKIELTGLRVDVTDGHNLAFGSATLPMGDEKAITLFADSLMVTDAARKGGPVHHFKGGADAAGVKQTAGFALLGAGAVLLGSGIVFGVQAQQRATAFRATPQTLTQVNANNASSGRTFAIVADVSYLLGIGAAVAGGVLAFSNVGDGSAEPAKPRRSNARSAPPPRDDAARKGREADDQKARDAAAGRRAKDDADRSAKEAADRGAKEKEDRSAKEAADRSAKDDADRRAKDDADRRAQAEADRKADRKAADEAKNEESKKKKGDDGRARAEEEARRREESDRVRKEAEERKRQEDEARAREDAERKRKEEEAKKKKKREDDDDLRNY